MAPRPTSCREKARPQGGPLRATLALPREDSLGAPSWTSFRLPKKAGEGKNPQHPPIGLSFWDQTPWDQEVLMTQTEDTALPSELISHTRPQTHTGLGEDAG